MIPRVGILRSLVTIAAFALLVVTSTGFACRHDATTPSSPGPSATPSQRGWTVAERIGDAGELRTSRGFSLMPDVDVGVDAAGNAVAVWQRQDTEGPNRIWSNRFRNGVGWGAAQEIDSGGRGDAYGPRVAVDPNENAMAVWAELERADLEGRTIQEWRTWANRYTPSQGWSNAVAIQPLPSAPQTSTLRFSTARELAPQVGVDAAGNALVLWLQSDIRLTFQNPRPPRSLVARRFLVDSGWMEPGEIGGPDSQGPRIAVSPGGTAVAAWEASKIWTRVFAADAGWQEPRALGDGFDAAVAIDSSGNAVAVWASAGVHASTFSPALSWDAPVRIANRIAGMPDVALGSQGNAITVWAEFTGPANPHTVMANRFTPSSGWTPEQRVGQSDDSDPRVVMDRDGSAVAVWKAFETSPAGAFSSRFVPGAGWTPTQRISSTVGMSWPRFESRTSIAIDGSGNVIAVWAEPDGPRGVIWASRYRTN